jgi:hypothetical protein
MIQPIDTRDEFKKCTALSATLPQTQHWNTKTRRDLYINLESAVVFLVIVGEGEGLKAK